MMIKGIGLDIVEIMRIQRANDMSDKFKERILTARELAIFKQLKTRRQLEFLAGRFSAKEAYAKANGTGLGRACKLHDIEILPNAVGKPELYFKGEKTGDFVSITHSKEYAAAQVIIMENFSK
ncbi:holo-[acyl-carrier-protein] synthase [Kurthia zopfii]|uniref:Holo-[acyl-carrier-protein] synthase n=2 Tax=Kurthia zopfii TaxID=1650 RepID=A0A8B4QDP8_9BACL|nr:holo-[acyl-carrier protein] synthase [Kurthia zopfii]GEK29846.1 holo-[acyl-carrier-protein] synthase [Kurthia zopfii]STX10866.1 Holo-[acyl-carrier-protein] synthase [Kurthia zopfii]